MQAFVADEFRISQPACGHSEGAAAVTATPSKRALPSDAGAYEGKAPMGRTIPPAIDTGNVPGGAREVIVLDAETLDVLSWQDFALARARPRGQAEDVSRER